MSATNSPNESNNIHADLENVAWTRKGNKIYYGSVKELTIDPLLNVRFHGESEVVAGVKPVDTYDIPSMKHGIVERGGIVEPIHVSVRPDNTKIVLRGNRRTRAGQELEADPTTPGELLKALRERTPMVLLHGLTPAQEIEMVNDQTQKPFLRSEVVRQIFNLRMQKWSFEQIAGAMWETLGRFTGNAKKIAEVRSITDPSVKREKIRSWLRGSLDCYLIWGCDLGPIIREYILLSEMQVDGVLPAEARKPYVIMTKDSQKRVAALKAAKQADGSKWSGQMLIEGSEFKKVIDEFHAADYGTTGKDKTSPGKKMMDRKSIEGMKEAFQSRTARAVIERILGETVPDLDTADNYAAMVEVKKTAMEQYLPRLRPDMAAIVRLILVNPDPTDFADWLEANLVQEEPEPEVQDNGEYSLAPDVAEMVTDAVNEGMPDKA